MNLSAARTILLEDYLDTTAGDAVGELSVSVLNRYINEAEQEACKRWDIIYDVSTSAVCEITAADGTRAYALHPKTTKIAQAVFTPAAGTAARLTQVTYSELIDYAGATWATGKPTYFAVRDRKLYLYPVPGTAEDGQTVSLEVWRLPLNDLALDTDTFEVDEQYQPDLLHWAAYRARSRRDEELGDPQGAGFHLGNFERVFGVPVSAQTLTHQLENPARVSFSRTRRAGIGGTY
jgi:hypothetical protein